jgi:hypothetical protein
MSGSRIPAPSEHANKARPLLGFFFFGGSDLDGQENLVELSGIEPLTSSLRTTRSPN